MIAHRHMPTAEEYQLVTDRIAFWQAYAPAVKSDLSSCAVRVEGGWVFVDPIPLAADALAELAGLAPPLAVVCTNGNHARAAELYRGRFGIPVLAHADAVPELGLAVDTVVSDGEVILGGLEVVALPGAAAGEIALHSRAKSLHVGDALIHLEATGFALLPDKYCLDARELRRAAGKLLRIDFELLTFAHGLPLAVNARQRLTSLLA
jgi:glyoxylase-like metal-dependent hydrolase (beta-lactamase superfamily II)